jgi:protein-ribulosamine 3-kinase
LPEQFSFTQLVEPSLRTHVEQLVSEHLQRRWEWNAVRDMSDYASHPAAILSDGSYSVFAKFSAAANGFERFEIELGGLRRLSELSGILTPAPIGILQGAGGSLLMLEAVQAVERGPQQWRQIGQALARMHKIKADRFGLETHVYFGSLYQDNSPMNNWPAFYAERRLLLGMKLAIDSGNLPPAVAGQLEKLIAILPGLCGPQVEPSLLHGDAQQNNFISTAQGPVFIDPAVYFGHPEMDLASIDFFQTAPLDVFDGYRGELPIDAGFHERRELWRIWGYLGCVTVAGPDYLGKLVKAIQKYI